MTKSQLIDTLCQRVEALSKRDAERAVSTIFGAISTALEAGGRAELRGFGMFSLRYRAQRVGRNPRTGERVEVADKHVPYFRAAQALRDRLNRADSPEENK